MKFLVTKVLLITTTFLFAFIGFFHFSETKVESTQNDNSKNLEGVNYFTTTDIDYFEQALCKINAKGEKFIDIEITKNHLDNLDFEVSSLPQETPQNNQNINYYFINVYDSFSKFEEDINTNNNINSGKYEIIKEFLLDSGEYVLILNEKFNVSPSANSKNEYIFTTQSEHEYLDVIFLLLEKLNFKINDININSTPSGKNYSICYEYPEDFSKAFSKTTDYIYMTYECNDSQVEDFKSKFTLLGFEIIDESIDDKNCMLTLRKV